MLPNWKPTAYAAGAILLVLIGVYSLGYRMGQAKVLGVATQAEMEAREAKGEADALKVQAQAKDAEIAARDSDIADAKSRLYRAEQKLARSKVARTPVVPVPIPSIPGSSVGSVGMEEPGRDLVGRQEAVINAQAEVIHQQDIKISSLEYSRDAWKGSAEAREREAAGLRIALEAQKSLTKGALWRGRISGFLVGAGVGYGGGKIR